MDNSHRISVPQAERLSSGAMIAALSKIVGVSTPGTGNHPAVPAFNSGYFINGGLMGQSKPFRATALIVEDDPMQREMICLLLEESDYDVIQCESAEAAELVLERNGGSLWLMMTDVSLAGHMNGIELAHIAKRRVPHLDVIVTSGRPLKEALPDGARFWPKPWVPLDVIREAEKMSLAHRAANENEPRGPW
jgi:two-component system cell cycle response regulator CpdR